jgi:hypothetical protein
MAISLIPAATAINGTLPFAQLPTGSVLQVVNATTSTQVTTTSTSFVTTGLAASITPRFSTSKVLILVTIPTATPGNSQNTTLTIYRGGTNLSSNTNLASFQGNLSLLYGTASLSFLDSPATTSSTTYTVYGASTGGGTSVFNNTALNGASSITLLEVAA